MKKACILCCACLLLAGCTKAETASSTNETAAVNTSYDTSDASAITFNEDSAEISGNGLSTTSDTVTISQPGTYVVTGTSSVYTIDVNVNSDGDVKIILQDVSLTSDSGPVITVSEASQTYIITESDSSLTSSGEDSEGETAVIMSHDDLIISGSGVLTLNGEEDGIKANDTCVIDEADLNITVTDDGINVNDALEITDSSVTVTSNGGYTNGEKTNMTGFEGEMPSGNPMGGSFMDESNEESEDDDTKAKGIKSDGTITISSSMINVDASDDALHSNDSITIESGTLSLSSGDDGIHADNTLTINDGVITISNSYEGLEAKYITINNGTIDITSSDDGINSADGDYTGNEMSADESYLTINGGTITISAEGDGIDMNGSGEMNGGTVTIYGPSNGANGALDFAGTFNVNGGTLLAGGAAGMQQSPSESSTIYSIVTDASGSIEVKDSDGNTIASYTSDKSYQNLVISSESFKEGETYTIYEDGSEVQSVTISSIITDVSTNSGMNQGGGMGQPGGNPPDGGMQGENPQGGNPPDGGETLTF